MNRYLLFIILITSCINSKSQNNKEIDSINNLLKNSGGTTKVDLLIDIADNYIYKNPGKTVVYGKTAEKLANELNNPELEAEAINSIGNGYYFIGDFDSAIYFYNRSLEKFIALKDTIGITSVLGNIGTAYSNKGDYVQSLDFGFRSLKLEESRKNPNGIGGSLLQIGNTYYYMNDLVNALKYYQKSYNTFQVNNYPDQAKKVLANIGIIHQSNGNSDSALICFEEYLGLAEKNNYSWELVNIYNNLGTLNLDLRNYNKAIEYYNKSIKISNDINNSNSRALTYMNLGDLYLEINKLDLAEQNTKKALDLYKEAGSKKMLSKTCKQLSLIYAGNQSYEKAWEYMSRHSNLNDSIYNEDVAAATTELQTKYETEKKEKEIAEQSLLIKEQQSRLRLQWTIIGGILILAIVIGIVIMLIFSRYRLKQKNKQTELEKKYIENEQRLLHAQMNPHFIFNSMASVQNYISSGKKEKAIKFISSFAELIRNILQNSRESTISLQEEIESLIIFLELEKLRMENTFEYQINLNTSLNTNNIFVPPMLIQPFVENAIKHGIKNIDDGLIELVFEKHDNTIRCTIRDNGIGRERADKIRKNNHKSLALEIIRERLEILKQLYHTELFFSIRDTQNTHGKVCGTEVIIDLPYETE